MKHDTLIESHKENYRLQIINPITSIYGVAFLINLFLQQKASPEHICENIEGN